MDFDSLNHAAAKRQLKLLGGVVATLETRTQTITPVWVLVERNVATPADNGLSVEMRTVCSLLVAEVASVERGDRIVSGKNCYTVNDILDDDGYVVRVYVRG